MDEWSEIIIQTDTEGEETKTIRETKNTTIITCKIWTEQGLDDRIAELHAQIEEIGERIEVLQEQHERFT